MKLLKPLLWISILLYSSQATSVIIGNKDWRQVLDTDGGKNISYEDLVTNNICDITTGICNGTFESTDFTGWIWATNMDVASLFYDVGIGPAGYFDTHTLYTEENATWGDEFISIPSLGTGDTGLFLDTYTEYVSPDIYTGFVYGITRSEPTDPQQAYIAGVSHSYSDGFVRDAAEIAPIPVWLSDDSFGIWLYKPVPEPSHVSIVIAALIGFSFVRRKANKP